MRSINQRQNTSVLRDASYQTQDDVQRTLRPALNNKQQIVQSIDSANANNKQHLDQIKRYAVNFLSGNCKNQIRSRVIDEKTLSVLCNFNKRRLITGRYTPFLAGFCC